jgi:anaerobic selenocysteine-containing dehydrogenase
MEISRLKKRGGKLIVVDPRKTETATKADIYMPVKPGRDEILILNMLHVLLRESLWDRKFTQKWVHKFQDFFQIVLDDRFSPEKGESWTGVEPHIVRQVTRAYAMAKPACIFTGNGLEHHSYGVNAMRLLAVMKAISGNLDVPGGELFTPRPKLKDITAPLTASRVPPIGAERFPLFCQARKEAHALSLPEAVLEHQPYPIKGMIIAGGNPTLEWPESSRTRQAIEALDFLMVIDVVASPDSHYAHLILPACTFLERAEHRVNVYQNMPFITLRRQVVRPVYGLPDQLIWIKLAKHMGFGKWFPWTTCEEGIDELLGDLGLSYEKIISRGGLFEYEKRQYRKYRSQGFHTPSGKVEIFSERLKNEDYEPSPVRKDLFDGFQGHEAFSLFLSTGGNLLGYLHWQYRYIPKLKRMAPEPMFEIHPLTAKHHGLSDGQLAKIETPHGSIRVRAHMSPRIRQDTIHVSQGWVEGNANELTSSGDLDPISGFPNLKSLRCRVVAA